MGWTGGQVDLDRWPNGRGGERGCKFRVFGRLWRAGWARSEVAKGFACTPVVRGWSVAGAHGERLGAGAWVEWMFMVTPPNVLSRDRRTGGTGEKFQESEDFCCEEGAAGRMIWRGLGR